MAVSEDVLEKKGGHGAISEDCPSMTQKNVAKGDVKREKYLSAVASTPLICQEIS